MKAKIEKVEPRFTPLRLVLDIESAEELRSLWHRFNICRTSLVPQYRKHYEISRLEPAVEAYLAINSACDKAGLL